MARSPRSSAFRFPRCLAALCALLMLAACQTNQVDYEVAERGDVGERLTGPEIRALIQGNTEAGRLKDGRQFHSHYARDGRLWFRAGSFRDQGQWWIEEPGLMCQRFDRARMGRTTCWRWYYDGTFLATENVRTGDGGLDIRVLDGDPEGLDPRGATG